MTTDKPKAAVLVVDNDEGVTRALSLRLEDAGYLCRTAHSGMQALPVLSRYPIDVIVTDLNMPCGSGIELVKQVRRTSDMPIIVVTGFSDEMRSGVRGQGVTVLRKPFEIQAVLDLIELEVIQHRREAA